MYKPQYTITEELLEAINAVVEAKAVIQNAPLLPLYEREFKSQAVARKVHFSTAIEGNYLQLPEVQNLLDIDQSSTNKDIDDVEPMSKPNDGVVIKKSALDHGRTLNTDSHLQASNIYIDANFQKADVIGISKYKVGSEQFIARRRDILEVVNYRDVVIFIEKLSKLQAVFVLTQDLIKEIHQKLLKDILDEVAGVYRDKNAMTVNYLTGEKLYPYEIPQNIEYKIISLLDWYNDLDKKIHPIIKAGLLHLEIVRIHPFAEGNGRLARALATLSLSVDGYDVNHFFCLDEYYDSDAKEYYDHLGAGFKDPIIWLEYFAKGMAIEFNRVKERVLKLSKDSKIKNKVGQRFVTQRQEKILEWINDRGYFCNKDFELLFPNISEDTILRELKPLLQDQIITKKGKTKSARYEYV